MRIAGWAVTHPIKGAALFEHEEDADAHIEDLKNKMRYHASKFKAWLYKQGTSEFWLPRT